jgi:hypothetical protein
LKDGANILIFFTLLPYQTIEQAPFIGFVYIFSSFEHVKKPADYGPQQH